jgi:uncharacterized protein YgiB involved in biofilm formation
MKRTKIYNHAIVSQSWSARHLTPVALAVTAVFMLAGCEKVTKRFRFIRTLTTALQRIQVKAPNATRLTMR